VKIDQVINLLAAITLIEMMITIGLGVEFSAVLNVARNWRLVSRALIANYVVVPAAALGLLLLFGASPMIAAGFLIAAVCPGAPYGPPFTGMAKGNVPSAVGLMVILAASSAVLAPLLLGLLLPFVAGSADLRINVIKIVGTLLGAQLLPLSMGLLIRNRRPSLAVKLKKPAGTLSLLLNVLLLAVILAIQFRMLAEIRPWGYMGMLCLVISCMVAGRLMGRRADNSVKGMVITTSVRNVGVGLVIASASFPGTAAISSATAYALFQTVLMAGVASAWGRMTPTMGLVRKKAA
jgi:BASS family bile acid:Na+ symporter